MRVLVEPLAALPTTTATGWEELVSHAAAPNPFSEPALAVPAAQSLADGQEAALLTVVADGRTLLAVPVVRARRFRRFPFGTLATWRHEHCCVGEPLVDAVRAHEAWDAVLHHVVNERISWLVLQLVYADSPTIVPLRNVLAERGLRGYEFDAYERSVVEKREHASADSELSARHRSDLRRKRRGLAKELGDDLVASDVLHGLGGTDAAVDAFLALEASGWKGREGTAMACYPGDVEFFRQTCAALHDAGRLEMWRLGSAERPAALACNIRTGERVLRFKLSYDESLRRYSPGVLLELDMLEAFHRDEQLRHLDSCAGAADDVYRRLYADRRPVSTLLVAPRSLPGRFVAAAAPASANAFRRVRRRAYRLVGRRPPPDYGLLD